MNAQVNFAHRAGSKLAPSWIDQDGFLTEADNWTPDLAEQLSREAGMGRLSAKQWEVIHFVRERSLPSGALPVMRLVCRAVGLDSSKGHQLFAGCRSLWLIAGLPNPGEEAWSYMN